MDHVAIMNKAWKLIPKILSGEKTIESRWSVNKTTPWGKIHNGDTIYFKNSGEQVTAKAFVSDVESYENLDKIKIRWILENRKGIAVNSDEESVEWAKNKKYCVLIYLEKPKTVKAFAINKRGFGSGAAWMCVDDVNTIALPSRKIVQ